jgi:hypothetical protein
LQGAVLVVAHGVVVDHRVACDVWAGIGLADLIGRLADDECQLRFPVQLCRSIVRDNDVVIGPGEPAYVALAEALNVVLVTADARLTRAPGIRCDIGVIAGAGSR